MWSMYDLLGYDQPEIFFTDNVTGDRQFLESVLPWFTRDVVPTELKRHSNLPLLDIQNDVAVHLLDSAGAINFALNMMMEDTDDDTQIVAGFDCEWPYNPVTQKTGMVCVIQIAYQNNVWILQLHKARQFSASLSAFLSSPLIAKAGLNIKGDLTEMQRDFNIVPANGLELAAFYHARGMIETKKISLASLA